MKINTINIVTLQQLIRSYWKFLLAFAVFLSGAVYRVSAASPVLEITSPAPDSVVSTPELSVNFRIRDFKLVDPALATKPAPGTGHLHLWLDQTSTSPQTATIIFQDNYTYTNLSPGPHTLKAELVSTDHSSLKPPVTAVLNFEVQNTLVQNSVGLNSNRFFLLTIFAFITILAALHLTSQNLNRLKSSSSRHKKKSR